VLGNIGLYRRIPQRDDDESETQDIEPVAPRQTSNRVTYATGGGAALCGSMAVTTAVQAGTVIASGPLGWASGAAALGVVCYRKYRRPPVAAATDEIFREVHSEMTELEEKKAEPITLKKLAEDFEVNPQALIQALQGIARADFAKIAEKTANITDLPEDNPVRSALKSSLDEYLECLQKYQNEVLRNLENDMTVELLREIINGQPPTLGQEKTLKYSEALETSLFSLDNAGQASKHVLSDWEETIDQLLQNLGEIPNMLNTMVWKRKTKWVPWLKAELIFGRATISFYAAEKEMQSQSSSLSQSPS
jgi:transcriptional regulator with XRE-family HTH domain